MEWTKKQTEQDDSPVKTTSSKNVSTMKHTKNYASIRNVLWESIIQFPPKVNIVPK